LGRRQTRIHQQARATPQATESTYIISRIRYISIRLLYPSHHSIRASSRLQNSRESSQNTGKGAPWPAQVSHRRGSPPASCRAIAHADQRLPLFLAPTRLKPGAVTSTLPPPPFCRAAPKGAGPSS